MPAPAPPPASSGDPVLDRRYAWGLAALDDGDPDAAADILAQTAAEVLHWPAVWHALGRAQVARLEAAQRAGAPGDVTHRLFSDAIGAFQECLYLDPVDALGARLRLAQITVGDPREAMSEAFVRTLFDAYAPRFEAHLTGPLAYRGPAILRDAVERACAALAQPPRFARVLDLGCGTGLMGAAVRDLADEVVGCDLSPAMAALARGRRDADGRATYARVEAAGLAPFLAAEAPASADLILAADVLVYVSDPAPVAAACARVLAPGGLLAVTAQRRTAGCADRGGLGPDDRYAHTDDELRAALEGAGLEVALLEPASTRLDRGEPVPGLVAVGVRAW